MAVFISPKAELPSNGAQLENRAILKYEIKKPPKGYDNPLRGSHDHLLVTHLLILRLRRLEVLLLGLFGYDG